MEEEIPSRLGRDQASQFGKLGVGEKKGNRKDLKWGTSVDPFTALLEWLVKKALLRLFLGEPSVPHAQNGSSGGPHGGWPRHGHNPACLWDTPQLLSFSG